VTWEDGFWNFWHGERGLVQFRFAIILGIALPLHSHPHEQIGMVYAGKGRLHIGDEERIVQKGDLYCIPGNVPHSDTCISDEPFVMLDIFYPVREYFIEKLKQSSDV